MPNKQLDTLDGLSISGWLQAYEAFAFHAASRFDENDPRKTDSLENSISNFFSILGDLDVTDVLADTQRARNDRVSKSLVTVADEAPNPLLTLMRNRRSRREFGEEPIKRADFNQILQSVGFHAARPIIPSAGGMQSLAVWVMVLNVDGLERGIYRLLFENKLLKVNKIPDHSVIQQMVGEHANSNSCGMVVWLGASVGRALFKYGNRGYRMLILEAGAAMYAVNIMSEYLHLNHYNSSAFQDVLVEKWIQAKPIFETVLIQVLIGSGKSG